MSCSDVNCSECWFWDRTDVELDFPALVQVAMAFGWMPPRYGEPKARRDEFWTDPLKTTDAFYVALRCALQILEARRVGFCDGPFTDQDRSPKERADQEWALEALGPNGVEMIRAYMEFAGRKLQEEAARARTVRGAL